MKYRSWAWKRQEVERGALAGTRTGKRQNMML